MFEKKQMLSKNIGLSDAILLITGCGSSSVELDINSEKVQSLYEMVTPVEEATVLKKLYEKPDVFDFSIRQGTPIVVLPIGSGMLHVNVFAPGSVLFPLQQRQ